MWDDGTVAQSRKSRKNARTSSTSASGCSSAAKCPPRSAAVQRRMSKKRSAMLRGGLKISFGNARYAVGTSMRGPLAGVQSPWREA